MKNFIEQAAILSSSELIHKVMATHVNIKYTHKKVIHTFDKNKKYFLYIHIPFCEEFCTFCSFHKFKYDAYICKKYFKKLRLEILKVKEQGFDFDTVYIGGGTPFIDEEELYKTIEFIKQLFQIKNISCETTPNHINPNVLKNFSGLIDRLSIGIQTFDDEILKSTSRYKKYGSSIQLQEKISNIIGVLPIISLDLIFNFPNQTKQMLVNDLQIARSLEVDQIITYPLMSKRIKHGSFFKHFKILKDNKEYEYYKTIKEELRDYYCDNAWAFSKHKSTLKDEYITDNNEYVGVGSGAFSHINNRLYVNAYDLNIYSSLIDNHSNAIIAMTEKFQSKKYLQYQFLVQLFSGEIDINQFDKQFDSSLLNNLKTELYLLKKVKAITINMNKIVPTKFGEYITVVMMKEFYSGMDCIRAKLRKTIKTD